MLRLDKTLLADSESWDFDFEFWPRQAEEYLEQGEYSKAIELCEKNIGSEPNLLSAKMIYAQALVGENRNADATEQLFQVLSLDPDNLAALKLLGDIQYRQDEFVSAMASYGRILEIDPDCRGLKCSFTPKEIEMPEPEIVILERGPEPEVEIAVAVAEALPISEPVPIPVEVAVAMSEPVLLTAKSYLVDSPFRTETVGDIYLKQGQLKEALEIFRELATDGQNNRIVEKLAVAEKMASQKERRDGEK